MLPMSVNDVNLDGIMCGNVLTAACAVFTSLWLVFLFNSWLLSQVSNIRRWIQLPLLILTGCWCLTCLPAFFLSIKVLTRQITGVSDLLTSDERLLSMERGFG